MDKLILMRSYRAVVETGSFTAAGQRLGRTKAMISRQITDLETDLAVRLVNRTTRKLNITEIGQSYYQQCCRLLNDLDDMESALQQGHSQAKGLLRITAPQTFGELHLIDAISDFLEKHPEVNIDLRLSDRFVGIVEEGFDMGVRIAQLGDSSLVACKLASIRIIICASADYVKKYGQPKTPNELVKHPCVIDTNMGYNAVWNFSNGVHVTVTAALRVNSALAVNKAIQAGIGIARCPSFAVQEDIASGRLIPLLEAYELEPRGLYVVYPHKKHLMAKVRLFVDFLVQHFSTALPAFDSESVTYGSGRARSKRQ